MSTCSKQRNEQSIAETLVFKRGVESALIALVFLSSGCSFNRPSDQVTEGVNAIIDRFVENYEDNEFLLFLGTVSPEKEVEKTESLVKVVVGLLKDRTRFRETDLGSHKMAPNRWIKVIFDGESFEVGFYDFGVMELEEGDAYRIPKDVYANFLENFRIAESRKEQ